MHFRLFYQGPLRSNGNPDHKHRIRRCFHSQLAQLWSQEPLKDTMRAINLDPARGAALGTRAGGYLFVPLVSQALELVAAIEITMLRPEPPGRVITQGGDIDNRLKTLLDAMQIPKVEQLPSTPNPASDENPFYCLLEDDVLVTSLSVTSDRLLAPTTSASEVILLVQIKLEFTHHHFTNLVPPPRLGPSRPGTTRPGN